MWGTSSWTKTAVWLVMMSRAATLGNVGCWPIWCLPFYDPGVKLLQGMDLDPFGRCPCMAIGHETIPLEVLVEAPSADEPVCQTQSPVWLGSQSTAFADP